MFYTLALNNIIKAGSDLGVEKERGVWGKRPAASISVYPP